MMGTKARLYTPLPTVTLDALVPADHFYRYLDRVLNLGFVRALVRDEYAEKGRPSIDPVVFFKLQLVMFFEGLRSERQLLRLAAGRLSVRWYLGYRKGYDLRLRERFSAAIYEVVHALHPQLPQTGTSPTDELIVTSGVAHTIRAQNRDDAGTLVGPKRSTHVAHIPHLTGGVCRVSRRRSPTSSVSPPAAQPCAGCSSVLKVSASWGSRSPTGRRTAISPVWSCCTSKSWPNWGRLVKNSTKSTHEAAE